MSNNKYWDVVTEQAYWDACAQEEAARHEKDIELIPRGAARELAYEILNHFVLTDFLSITPADIDEKVDAIPAVPQEPTAREFANEFRRMCDAYLNCMEDGDDCPLFTANICSLDELVDIVPIVEQWAKEHPEKKRKTYAEDFFSKYPDAPHSTKNGMTTDRPAACRMVIYGGCPLCITTKCDCAACWNAEMEDADE